MKKITTEKKEELVKAARIAKRIPGQEQFWREVGQRMDIRQKNMVKPR